VSRPWPGAHDQLFQGADIEQMDLGKYVEGVCKDLDASVAHCIIHTEVQYGIEFSADRAISAALVVNELIANSAKHAYRGKQGGKVQVRIAGVGEDNLSISVRDKGTGMPEDFDLAQPKGLGMQIVTSFVKQLNGSIEIHHHNPGTEFVVILPR
jgi:two-component sensor histidine kinase